MIHTTLSKQQQKAAQEANAKARAEAIDSLNSRISYRERLFLCRKGNFSTLAYTPQGSEQLINVTHEASMAFNIPVKKVDGLGEVFNSHPLSILEAVASGIISVTEITILA